MTTCPICHRPYASCAHRDEQVQAFIRGQTVDGARIACPRGHETSVRRKGAGFWCGLCGREWAFEAPPQ